jgi:DNA mismatch repair protein MutL
MIVRVLPDQVVNQIAAGEVVERPASVVKELVENSLDAEATRIEVKLESGGTKRIRVADDGVGMDREDAMMCLERHATSKIRATDDLETVVSLGFRGEAIPSIASVSRFTLLTRPHDVDEGVRVVVEGGEVKRAGAAGCAPGTSMDVKDLFFNLPARRKFLRARATEYAHCLEAVARQALARPEVAFRVTHDGRVTLSAESTDLTGRTRQVLGKDAAQMVDVAFTRGGLTVEGRVSPMSMHRPAGRSLYVYVNGRYVRDAVVRRAIAEAYRDRVPRGRHPLAVLSITLDPSEVDCNVHPAKTEVRFRSPRDVSAHLSEGLRAAIDQAGLVRTVAAPSPNRRARYDEASSPALPLGPVASPVPAHPDDDPLLAVAAVAPAPVETAAFVATETASSGGLAPSTRGGLAPSPGGLAPSSPGGLAPSSEGGLAPLVAADRPATESARALRPIGPFGTRWFLCEGDQELVVVDHVRGEELLAARRLQQTVVAQRLLVPRRERLSARDAEAVLAKAEELSDLGLEIVPMSPTEVAIRTVPAALPRLHLDGLLARLAGARSLSEALARAQTPPPVPDTHGIRSLLLSLEEAGLDAVVRRIPAADLT